MLGRVYDAAAAGWQTGIAKLGFPEAYRDLMRHVPHGNDRSVLDVGTGSGAFADAWVAVHGTPAQLVLTDLSPAMLDVAAVRFPEARCLCAPVGAPVPDLPPQEVVLCAHVIEHLDDPEAALVWMGGLLRPGGTLVLALSRPHWCTALVRWRWGNAAFDPETACQMLARAGFDHITAHPFVAGPPSRVSCGYVARRPLRS